MPDEVAAEPAARIGDAAVGRQLDEVGGLLVVEVVGRDQLEPHGGGDHALLEVVGIELEPVAEELDDEVVARTRSSSARIESQGYSPARGHGDRRRGAR